MQDDKKPKLYEIFQGQVASVQAYGAFVKIPKCKRQGLVHKSQMSNARIEDPNEMLAKGEMVHCKVIALDVEGDKISLSMKVVNQTTGADLDPNNIQSSQDEKKRREWKHVGKNKIELGAELNTTCSRCGGHGHLTMDCYVGKGGNSYDLLPDMDELLERAVVESDKKKKDHKKKKSKKEKKKKKKRKNSSTSDSSDSSEQVDRHHKMSNHKKSERHYDSKSRHRKLSRESISSNESDSYDDNDKHRNATHRKHNHKTSIRQKRCRSRSSDNSDDEIKHRKSSHGINKSKIQQKRQRDSSLSDDSSNEESKHSSSHGRSRSRHKDKQYQSRPEKKQRSNYDDHKQRSSEKGEKRRDDRSPSYERVKVRRRSSPHHSRSRH